jgi:hypothetical protein
MVAFMRSPHPDIRALDRQLALAAHRARMGAVAPAADVAPG